MLYNKGTLRELMKERKNYHLEEGEGGLLKERMTLHFLLDVLYYKDIKLSGLK
jgi:hypothetical protein